MELAEPRFLTVSTYQALHAAGRKLSFVKLLSRLQAAGVRTLVLDEAHHLRRQWWQSLAIFLHPLPLLQARETWLASRFASETESRWHWG